MGISTMAQHKLYRWIILALFVMGMACKVRRNPQQEYSMYENMAWKMYGQQISCELMTNAILDNLNKAINMAPDLVRIESYLLRAQCWLIAEENIKAYDDWTVVIERSPMNTLAARAYCGRAVYLGQQKEYQEALSDIDQAIYLYPYSSLARAVRAILLKDMGMHEKAKDEMTAAIGLNPNVTNGFDYCEFVDAVTSEK